MHSHEDKAVVKFKRDVQPDMIHVHDLTVQIANVDCDQYTHKIVRV